MKHSLIKVGMITTSILLSCGITKNVQAATNQPDQYEVKVYADSHKVVKDNRHIKHSVLEALGSSDKDEDFNVQYLDDSNRTNYQNNVTYRLRKSEDDNDHELQYKKRYPISNHDVSRAIQQAKSEGYNGDEYEVEFGENKETLSVTNEAKENLNLEKNAMPNAQDSLKILKAHAEKPYSETLNKMNQPSLIGPVHFERHKGNIDGNKVKIENWDIKNQNIVEISAKVNNEEDAKRVQSAIVKKLDQLGIHEKKDQLKTNLIFDNY
ncbi:MULTISPECIES: hypothetical protein [Staphylococcus]|uniref:Lipoprotein n=1 Tax=Staphylococcus caprae TaxID=29380 RepID=A0ABM7FTE4_9STAP|nr:MULTISPECIES: hypothetical protein [Staphylococcus]EES41513.1 hypothetical protein HMPREF0793_0835 [Staphylococcus caprae M23864:W1]MBN6826498.1 hypothetical protein [Staphylococcus caprae]MBX5317483.1 hypothetical protein [Staphylococcus caprae]MBX5323305.1 hypothetical protein [Staphylococcus caprae]MCI2954863.1 hypothetical protein [Staphylococcus caprae]